MSRQSWQETLWAVTADGTPIANTATETIIFPDVTIPANYFADGRVLELIAGGVLSTTATPTMIFSLRLGGVAGTVLAVTEALTMGSGVANANWSLRILLQTRLSGTAGSIIAMGHAHVHTAIGTIVNNVFGISGWDASAPATGLALTTDKDLSLTAKWSAASASNTLTGLMYIGASLN